MAGWGGGREGEKEGRREGGKEGAGEAWGKQGERREREKYGRRWRIMSPDVQECGGYFMATAWQ